MATAPATLVPPEQFGLERDNGSSYADPFLLSLPDLQYFQDHPNWIIHAAPNPLLVDVGSTLLTGADAQHVTMSVTSPKGEKVADIDLSPGGWKNGQWHWLTGVVALDGDQLEVFVFRTTPFTLDDAPHAGIRIDIFKRGGAHVDDRPIFHKIVTDSPMQILAVRKFAGGATHWTGNQDNVGNGHEP